MRAIPACFSVPLPWSLVRVCVERDTLRWRRGRMAERLQSCNGQQLCATLYGYNVAATAKA
jgi:hypothetical protein